MASDKKNSVHLIDLPKVKDPRGNLTVIESGINVPFKVMRNYWIYDVPTACGATAMPSGSRTSSSWP